MALFAVVSGFFVQSLVVSTVGDALCGGPLRPISTFELITCPEQEKRHPPSIVSFTRLSRSLDDQFV